jgi:choline-glycine betaine transporter
MYKALLIIGKASFLLVIIGFCIPVAFDSTGLQIAQSEAAPALVSIILYVLFVTAIIGFLFFILHIVDILIIPEWLDSFSDIAESKIITIMFIIICICCGLIPFFIFIKEYRNEYQTGAILTAVGCAIITLTHIISLVMKIKEDRHYRSSRSTIDFSNDYERDPRDICP